MKKRFKDQYLLWQKPNPYFSPNSTNSGGDSFDEENYQVKKSTLDKFRESLRDVLGNSHIPHVQNPAEATNATGYGVVKPNSGMDQNSQSGQAGRIPNSGITPSASTTPNTFNVNNPTTPQTSFNNWQNDPLQTQIIPDSDSTAGQSITPTDFTQEVNPNQPNQQQAQSSTTPSDFATPVNQNPATPFEPTSSNVEQSNPTVFNNQQQTTSLPLNENEIKTPLNQPQTPQTSPNQSDTRRSTEAQIKPELPSEDDSLQNLLNEEEPSSGDKSTNTPKTTNEPITDLSGLRLAIEKTRLPSTQEKQKEEETEKEESDDQAKPEKEKNPFMGALELETGEQEYPNEDETGKTEVIGTSKNDLEIPTKPSKTPTNPWANGPEYEYTSVTLTGKKDDVEISNLLVELAPQGYPSNLDKEYLYQTALLVGGSFFDSFGAINTKSADKRLNFASAFKQLDRGFKNRGLETPNQKQKELIAVTILAAGLNSANEDFNIKTNDTFELNCSRILFNLSKSASGILKNKNVILTPENQLKLVSEALAAVLKSEFGLDEKDLISNGRAKVVLQVAYSRFINDNPFFDELFSETTEPKEKANETAKGLKPEGEKNIEEKNEEESVIKAPGKLPATNQVVDPAEVIKIGKKSPQPDDVVGEEKENYNSEVRDPLADSEHKWEPNEGGQQIEQAENFEEVDQAQSAQENQTEIQTQQSEPKILGGQGNIGVAARQIQSTAATSQPVSPEEISTFHGRILEKLQKLPAQIIPQNVASPQTAIGQTGFDLPVDHPEHPNQQIAKALTTEYEKIRREDADNPSSAKIGLKDLQNRLALRLGTTQIGQNNSNINELTENVALPAFSEAARQTNPQFTENSFTPEVNRIAEQNFRQASNQKEVDRATGAGFISRDNQFNNSNQSTSISNQTFSSSSKTQDSRQEYHNQTSNADKIRKEIKGSTSEVNKINEDWERDEKTNKEKLEELREDDKALLNRFGSGENIQPIPAISPSDEIKNKMREEAESLNDSRRQTAAGSVNIKPLTESEQEKIRAEREELAKKLDEMEQQGIGKEDEAVYRKMRDDFSAMNQMIPDLAEKRWRVLKRKEEENEANPGAANPIIQQENEKELDALEPMVPQTVKERRSQRKDREKLTALTSQKDLQDSDIKRLEEALKTETDEENRAKMQNDLDQKKRQRATTLQKIKGLKSDSSDSGVKMDKNRKRRYTQIPLFFGGRKFDLPTANPQDENQQSNQGGEVDYKKIPLKTEDQERIKRTLGRAGRIGKIRENRLKEDLKNTTGQEAPQIADDLKEGAKALKDGDFDKAKEAGKSALDRTGKIADKAKNLAGRWARNVMLKAGAMISSSVAPVLIPILIASMFLMLLIITFIVILCTLDPKNPSHLPLYTVVKTSPELSKIMEICNPNIAGSGNCPPGYTAYTRTQNPDGSYAYTAYGTTTNVAQAAGSGNGTSDTGSGAENVKCLAAPRSGAMSDPNLRAVARALKVFENGDRYDGPANELGCYGAYQFCPYGAWGDAVNYIKSNSSDFPGVNLPSTPSEASPEQQDWAFAAYFLHRFSDSLGRLKQAGNDVNTIGTIMDGWCNGWTPFGKENGGCTKNGTEGKQSKLISLYLKLLPEEQSGKCGTKAAVFLPQDQNIPTNIRKLITPVKVEAAEQTNLFGGIKTFANESDQAIRDRVSGYYQKGEFYQVTPQTDTAAGIKNGNFDMNIVKLLDNLYREGLAVVTGPVDWGRSSGDHVDPSRAIDIWGLGNLSDIKGEPIKGLKLGPNEGPWAGGSPDTAADNGNTVDPRIRRHVDIPVDSTAKSLFEKAYDIAYASDSGSQFIGHKDFIAHLRSNKKSLVSQNSGYTLQDDMEVYGSYNGAHFHHFHVAVVSSSTKEYKYSQGVATPSSGASGASSSDIWCCPNGQSPNGGNVTLPQTGGGGAGDSSYPGKLNPTGFISPSKGVFTSPYGQRDGTPHPGIDIATPEGETTPIYAVAEGKAEVYGGDCPDNGNGCNEGAGNFVFITHQNGMASKYLHLAQGSIKIKTGDTVKQGQQIGVMGHSGYSTGKHLHFEVIQGGGSKGNVDPCNFISCPAVNGEFSVASATTKINEKLAGLNPFQSIKANAQQNQSSSSSSSTSSTGTQTAQPTTKTVGANESCGCIRGGSSINSGGSSGASVQGGNIETGIDGISCLSITGGDFSPELRAFMRAISFTEGSTKAEYYFILVGGKVYPQNTTVHPGIEKPSLYAETGFNSDAFGKYQMLSTTWNSWAADAGVPIAKGYEGKTNTKGEPFYDMSPQYQDLAVGKFLQKAGIETMLKSGQIDSAINTDAACQWASVPGNRGGCSQPNSETPSFKPVYLKLLEEEKSPNGCGGSKIDVPPANSNTPKATFEKFAPLDMAKSLISPINVDAQTQNNTSSSSSSSSTSGQPGSTSPQSTSPLCPVGSGSTSGGAAGISDPNGACFPVTNPYEGPGPNQSYGAPRKDRIHAGIDFTPPASISDGEASQLPVLAYKAGEVTAADPTNFGIVIIMHADGTRAKYLHNSKVLVKIGDKVQACQEIAKQGGIDGYGLNSYPIHLHLQLHDKNDNPIDPTSSFLNPDKSPKTGLIKKGNPQNVGPGL